MKKKIPHLLLISFLTIIPFMNSSKISINSCKDDVSEKINFDELFEKIFIKTIEQGQNDWGKK